MSADPDADHIERLRRQLEGIIESGLASQAEGEEAWAFFDQLADAELAGEVTREQALALIHQFTEAQLAKRGGAPQ